MEKIILKKDSGLYVNQRFGKLVLTGRYESKKFKNQRYTIFEANCDCGKSRWVTKPNLQRGFTKSCGCAMYKTARLYEFQNKFLTIREIAKIKGVKKSFIESRIRTGIPLFAPKYYRQRSFNPDSMAGLARQVGVSRERIRQLMKDKNLTREQILERYKN